MINIDLETITNIYESTNFNITNPNEDTFFVTLADLLWYAGHSIFVFGVLVYHFVWYIGVGIIMFAQFITIISRPIGRIKIKQPVTDKADIDLINIRIVSETKIESTENKINIDYQLISDVMWYVGHMMTAFGVYVDHYVFEAGVFIVCFGQFTTITSRMIERISVMTNTADVSRSYQILADILWYGGHTLSAICIVISHYVWYVGFILIVLAQVITIISRPIGRIANKDANE